MEQLKKLRLVPVYVDRDLADQKAGSVMRANGAKVWPQDMDSEEMGDVVTPSVEQAAGAEQQALF